MAGERTLKEYAITSLDESYDDIVYPTIDGNNFEISPALIYLLQQKQFFGSPTEDPNFHISTFLRFSGTLKANQEAVRLHLFPFSLRDRASAWFHSLTIGSITSWDQMRRTFLAQFFSLSKTAQLRARLFQFTQKDGESLYNAWERFKEMLRLCPLHGLEKWLIIHVFYNGLLFATKMNVDAAAGGALMNKTYTGAYALIEDMAQNHYQWISERVITVVTPPSSKKEADMYQVSTLDHLSAKVDALLQKFDKLSVSVVTPAPVSPSCEFCGILGHNGVECQLGSVAESPEQNFHNKTPKNPFGQQTTPPGYANNQRVPQKSSLEILLEKFIMDPSKQFQELTNQTGFLNDSLVKLTSKVDSIDTHTKMLEPQISQVAQQVATSSKTPGVFPSQTEINLKGCINAITLRYGKKLEDPVVKSKIIEGEIESEKQQGEKVIGESDKSIVSPPYKLKIHFPQRLAKPNLIVIESFSTPCVIESETIKKAMCDLGDSVSLMSLSLWERLGREIF